MELEKTIAHYCNARGWTLAKLAREAGIPKPTLHGWKTGRKALDLRQLKKVASVFEISLHELVFGEPDPFESKSHEILKELFSGDIRVSIKRIERRKNDK